MKAFNETDNAVNKYLPKNEEFVYMKKSLSDIPSKKGNIMMKIYEVVDEDETGIALDIKTMNYSSILNQVNNSCPHLKEKLHYFILSSKIIEDSLGNDISLIYSAKTLMDFCDSKRIKSFIGQVFVINQDGIQKVITHFKKLGINEKRTLRDTGNLVNFFYKSCDEQ